MVIPEESDLNLNVRVNPVRLAWGIVLVSFAVFCLLCITSTLGVYYFMFESSIPLDTVLYVGRGTVGVKAPNAVEQAESDQRVLSNSTFIRTDQTDILSQAIITIHDQHYDNKPIMWITLKGATSLRFRNARGPRFDWSSATYDISLSEVFGEIDVLVADNLDRAIQLNIYTQNNTEIQITSSGKYNLKSDNLHTDLSNFSGRAVLIASDQNFGLPIGEGQQGTFYVGDAEITSAPVVDNLINNSELQLFDPGNLTVGEELPDLPVGWSCSNGPLNNLPRGSYRADVSPDGRESFRLIRSGASSNGYTRCEQSLGTPLEGLNVTGYDSLTLQAKFYVDYQALSGCGTQGTECSMWFVIEFIDVSGASRVWRQGVYARFNPGTAYPLHCDTCSASHIRIYEKTWYTYESNDFFTFYSPDSRPARITNVTFQAEGHDYNVYVDEISLLATSK